MSISGKITDAGFSMVADGDRLLVSPANELSDEQRRFVYQHKTKIIAELQSATVHDLDRHAVERDALIIYWRFLLNGVAVDFASGANVAEAVELLRIGSDDELEPIIEYDKSDMSLASSAESMPGWQETTIRLWLDHIGEDDPDVIVETISKCHADINAREFILNRARQALDDQRATKVTCGDCQHFQPDTIGDGTGIGSCAVDIWKPERGPCLYPKAERFCNDFKGVVGSAAGSTK